MIYDMGDILCRLSSFVLAPCKMAKKKITMRHGPFKLARPTPILMDCCLVKTISQNGGDNAAKMSLNDKLHHAVILYLFSATPYLILERPNSNMTLDSNRPRGKGTQTH